MDRTLLRAVTPRLERHRGIRPLVPDRARIRAVVALALLLCAVGGSWGADTAAVAGDAPGAATAPSASSPREEATWGLGFRAFQSGTGFQNPKPRSMLPQDHKGIEIHAWRMVSDRASVGLSASWIGGYLGLSSWEDQEPASTSDKGYGCAKFSLPVEWILKRKGPVSALASIGPLYELSFDAEQSESPRAALAAETAAYDDEFHHRIGATAGLGMRWEFAPGIALASSFGADAWYTFGSATHDPSTTFDWTSESTGFGTRSWFGGIGLDAWF